MLETAPSLSIYNTIDGAEEHEEKIDGEFLRKSLKIEGKIDENFLGSGDFSFAEPNMDLIKEEGDELGESVDGFEKKLGDEEVEPPPSPPMYLASGLGLGIRDGFDSFRAERENDEEYYRELLNEFPNHPLVLIKFAQFLKRKGDLQGAEEYYFRATKADPSDGEILSQYALLVWELYRDQERASAYFELAAQTAPKDCNVLASYAKFLWEVDDDEDEGSIQPDHGQQDLQKSIHLHPADGTVVGIDGGNDGPVFEAGALISNADVEDYYKRMMEKDPYDPLLMKKYAQFLYQSKGDLQGAEEYYSRAILAYPQDGELLSQYATLFWELHHDQKKTLYYMERAVEAASGGDCNILAAYARFLWTIDDDEN